MKKKKKASSTRLARQQQKDARSFCPFARLWRVHPGLASTALPRGSRGQKRAAAPAAATVCNTRAKTLSLPRVLRLRWFCVAGLWNRVMIEGSELDTFTILTTDPNDATAGIHSRMPVIIYPEDYERWMRAPYQEVFDLMKPCAAADIDAWPVKPDVGNVRNQGPELIEEA